MTNTVRGIIRKPRQKKGIPKDRHSKYADLELCTVVKIEPVEGPNPTVEILEKISKALRTRRAERFK